MVVAVGGCRSNDTMNQKYLFDKNADDVRLTALHMVEFNPKAVLCLAKPPIEAMVPLVSQVSEIWKTLQSGCFVQ